MYNYGSKSSTHLEGTVKTVPEAVERVYDEGNLVDTFVSVWGLNDVETDFEVNTLRKRQHRLIGIHMIFLSRDTENQRGNFYRELRSRVLILL